MRWVMRRALLLLLPLSALSTACFGFPDPPEDTPSDAGLVRLDGSGGGGGGAGLPCEVDAILATRCRGCHSATPAFGAPMPLLTADDFHAPAASDPSRPVLELVKRRIHDDVRPMPASGPLPADELAVLDAWLDRGAPSEACTTDTPPPPDTPTDVGPDALPCDETHRFTAHASGSATAEFHVPEDAGNLYMCFTFRSPFDGTEQGTAWAPILDDDRVVHHWILYRTSTPQVEGGVGPCQMPGDSTFVAGWAPGGRNWIMPDDVGLELPGPDQWLILQVHYWNVAGYTDADDSSGVAFCTTDTPRAHKAGVYTLGDAVLSIPPRSTGHIEQGVCPSWATRFLPEPVYALGSFPHMHQRGREIRTEILRGGDPRRVDTLIRIDRWDFESQDFHPHTPPIRIDPGDELRTTCVYDNPTDATIRFGERTEDEMCLEFVMIYPIEIFTGQRQCGLI